MPILYNLEEKETADLNTLRYKFRFLCPDPKVINERIIDELNKVNRQMDALKIRVLRRVGHEGNIRPDHVVLNDGLAFVYTTEEIDAFAA